MKNQRKHSDNIVGLGLTKKQDSCEIAIKFADDSDFIFECEFKTTGECIATVGIGDIKGLGKYNDI